MLSSHVARTRTRGGALITFLCKTNRKNILQAFEPRIETEFQIYYYTLRCENRKIQHENEIERACEYAQYHAGASDLSNDTKNIPQNLVILSL
jgi:hypothetical protein